MQGMEFEGQVDLARAELSRYRPMHEPRSMLERAGWWAIWRCGEETECEGFKF